MFLTQKNKSMDAKCNVLYFLLLNAFVKHHLTQFVVSG